MSIKVPKRTVVFQEKGQLGAARLSPDLTELGESFVWSVDKKKRTVRLDAEREAGPRLWVWKSNERSRSGYLGLTRVLRELEIDPISMRGNIFNVKPKGRSFILNFGDEDENSADKNRGERVGVQVQGDEQRA